MNNGKNRSPITKNVAFTTKNRALIFAERNFREMTRDPVIYIFCLAFPVAMLALFAVINRYSGGKSPVFEFPSLIPGVITFSYSFVMLTQCLLVSKDKTTSLLKRLYTSPMKKSDFVIGYALPAFVLGLIQTAVCIVAGYVISLVVGSGYIGFVKCLLLAAEQLPALIINVFSGIIVGALLNEKSAPAITSIAISASGILGGAWMPLDTMGNFEVFCRFLPFYPSVYLGRIVTGATHTPTDFANPAAVSVYSFDATGVISIIVLSVYLLAAIVLSVVTFGRMMKKAD